MSWEVNVSEWVTYRIWECDNRIFLVTWTDFQRFSDLIFIIIIFFWSFLILFLPPFRIHQIQFVFLFSTDFNLKESFAEEALKRFKSVWEIPFRPVARHFFFAAGWFLSSSFSRLLTMNGECQYRDTKWLMTRGKSIDIDIVASPSKLNLVFFSSLFTLTLFFFLLQFKNNWWHEWKIHRFPSLIHFSSCYTAKREWRTDYETDKWNRKSKIDSMRILWRWKSSKLSAGCWTRLLTHDFSEGKLFPVISSRSSSSCWITFLSSMLNLWQKKRKHVVTISNEPCDVENLIRI